ncbi:MAG: type II toxin-antitoxin system RelE/ParE family toxin [Gammaproteobacteria bacterium]|nr:type II toxin-antitoxin system RelE/ParE family toxin [Gammaproteobacteria bacterium]
MIRGFRHKGLLRLYESGSTRDVPASLVPRLSRVLARLDVAASPGDMNLPGWRLHRLKGDRAGCWSVWISGNWRLVFRFDGVEARDVDLVDYH